MLKTATQYSEFDPEAIYDQGDRVGSGGGVYECYEEHCATLTRTSWKRLMYSGCDWLSMCEMPRYQDCLGYVTNDVVTVESGSGMVSAYQCLDFSHSGACANSAPGEDDAVWLAITWMVDPSKGGAEYACAVVNLN
jgi:hypothetical protein